MGSPSPSSVPVSRDGVSTISRTAWPIIIVPGIMGSRLRRSGTQNKIWDPDHLAFNVGLMTRSPDSLATLFTPESTPGEVMTQPHYARLRSPARVARGWGGPAWDYYGRGIEEIQNTFVSRGGVVYCFGYDWRKSNLDTGRQLNEWIERTIRPNFRFKPIIVTHSNGGLVTRAASRNGGESSIAAVIHTFMPTYGSPESFATLRLGEKNALLSQIIGATGEETAVIGSGVKVLFQLLPNQLYPSLSGGRWATWDEALAREADPNAYTLTDPYALYRESTGRLGLVNHARFNANAVIIRNGTVATGTRRRLARLLSNVEEARRYHDQVRSYAHPQTYLITGTGLDTTVGVRIRRVQDVVYGVPLQSQGRVERIKGQGDETVAEPSGRAFEDRCIRTSLLANIGHSAAFNSSFVITQTIQYIYHIRNTLPDRLLRW